ncbi:hypothetical protein U9M48_031802 [Paspalum notatum var. saurae]|uniref:Retroviral polymerase SH3-like domain-containing protein n=1 Tax=Paspalum notatum var. saurae TaxID=547442 RepID=A0AAQ3U7K7_PASNO
MSCPYTSAQNGRAERMICSINNIIRSLLFQASMTPVYWVEPLGMSTHLINLLPTKTLNFSTPYQSLLGATPSLWVFGCLCYPNTTATAPYKLAPRSARCVFLGLSPNHKGYRCLDLSSNRGCLPRHAQHRCLHRLRHAWPRRLRRSHHARCCLCRHT